MPKSHERNSNKPKWSRFAGSLGTRYHALAPNMQSDDESWRMWLDAVCIDQSNIAERNFQVGMMGRIYNGAFRTVVWLGEQEDSTGAAIRSIGLVVRQCRDSTKGLSDLYKLIYGRTGFSRSYVPSQISTDVLPASCDWSAIEALYRRTWFTRLWVVQEALLNETVVVYIGQHLVRFFDLALAARWMVYRRPDLTARIGYEPKGIVNAAILFDFMFGELSSQLDALLMLGLRFDSTDPKDKVYGILGLKTRWCTGPYPVLPFCPDYNRSVADVYRDATRIALYESGSLDLLRLCCLHLEQDELPSGASQSRPLSWVPRYDLITAQCDDHRTRIFATGDRLHPYMACRFTLRFGARSLYPFNHNLKSLCFPNILRIPGQIEGVLSRLDFKLTNALISDDRKLGDLITSMQAWADDANECFHRRAKPSRAASPTAESRDIEFALTLTCGVDESNVPIPRKDHHLVLQDFHALRRSLENNEVDHVNGDGEKFRERMALSCRNRRFCTTTNGYYGMVPAAANEGDAVVHLAVSKVLLVLRECTDGRWILVGDAYLNRAIAPPTDGEILSGKHWRKRVIFDIK
jgi:hypothetical protein